MHELDDQFLKSFGTLLEELHEDYGFSDNDGQEAEGEEVQRQRQQRLGGTLIVSGGLRESTEDVDEGEGPGVEELRQRLLVLLKSPLAPFGGGELPESNGQGFCGFVSVLPAGISRPAFAIWSLMKAFAVNRAEEDRAFLSVSQALDVSESTWVSILEYMQLHIALFDAAEVSDGVIMQAAVDCISPLYGAARGN